jgi:hypothetical protein
LQRLHQPRNTFYCFVNIETSELIQRLRDEEEQRHRNQQGIESARHERELSLIAGLEETVNRWTSEGLPARNGDAAEAEPQPEPEPAHTPVRGRAAMKGGGVNCSEAARKWIAARGTKPFLFHELCTDLAEETKLVLATVKTRMMPFVYHLVETGQLDSEGVKKNRVYTVTKNFKADKPARGAIALPTVKVDVSDRERKWREQREAMNLGKPVE